MKGTSKQGGTQADAVINDYPGSAHVDSPDDVVINCAANAHPKSQEDHD